MSLARTRELLDRYGLRLRRELGQNFLVDAQWAERLVELAGVGSGDFVLEIGTGLGALTRALAARAERVVTIEIDSGVVRALREERLLPDAVELLHADALRTDLAALLPAVPRERVRLVANLPYSAATPLLRRMLDLRDRFAGWSVMVQREVGARLVAQPRSRDYGSLAVLHALATETRRVADLPAGCFFPVPRVTSSFLCFEPRPLEAIGEAELRRVERVVRAAFGQRRKTIANALRAGGLERAAPEVAGGEAGEGRAQGALQAALADAAIDPRARAEVLDPDSLRRLTRALHERGVV